MGRIAEWGVFLIGGAFLVWVIGSFTKPKDLEIRSEYQLVQLGEMRRDQFLLDKKTGRIWTSVCFGKTSGADCDGLVIWQEMIRKDNHADSSISTDLDHVKNESP